MMIRRYVYDKHSITKKRQVAIQNNKERTYNL